MYPELSRIGEFVVTSFGVMVAVGALVGLWLFARELRLARWRSATSWRCRFRAGGNQTFT